MVELGVWLLLTLRVETYVFVKTILDAVVKVGAIGLSVWWFRRVLASRGVTLAHG